MEIINEEMHLEKEWFEQAREQTLETLPQFIDHLMNDFEHDYGTVCHAIAACAIAAANAADSSPQGGITGFQASFIMWDFIKYWMKSNNKCGLKLVDYDNMLYPQYSYRYDKTISPSVWKNIQKEAAKLLDENYVAVDEVRAHWQSIVNGEVPFGYRVEKE